jgi:hypothetical protein
MIKSANKSSMCCFRINGCKVITAVLLLTPVMVFPSCSGPVAIDSLREHFVAEARRAILNSDAAMGDWRGSCKLSRWSNSEPLVAQVVALGKGLYRANLLSGFDRRTGPLAVLDGNREGNVVRFVGKIKCENGVFTAKATTKGAKLTGTFEGPDARGTFAMEHVFRVSPTMGAKPPKGAVVLFNGKDFKEWKTADKKEGEDEVKWELIAGAMVVKPGTGSIVTRRQFGDVVLHIEFRTPFMPEARGQSRGNSGVYLQGRYEVQVLDSYGVGCDSHGCGGIYGISKPLVNMCAPPGQWQTYDITFRAPRFDIAGKKVSSATVMVVHNGVMVQEMVEMEEPTAGAAGGNTAEPTGVYLQDHGNQVEYRNIWLVEQ